MVSRMAVLKTSVTETVTSPVVQVTVLPSTLNVMVFSLGFCAHAAALQNPSVTRARSNTERFISCTSVKKFNCGDLPRAAGLAFAQTHGIGKNKRFECGQSNTGQTKRLPITAVGLGFCILSLTSLPD